MLDIVRIPEERKAVLIGKKGEIKKRIESETHTEIAVDDAVQISGEPLNVMKAKKIVTAIARGFNPDVAFLLLSDEYTLHIISLSGESKATRKRLLGRVIGRKGQAKRIIEDYTDTHIAVYGKTVAIIGKFDDVQVAARAVDELLAGRSHGYVFKRLARAKAEKEMEIL